MRILGVDPGSRITGFGVIDCDGARMQSVCSGTIDLPAGMSMPDRLRQIHEALLELIDTYHPDSFCLETAFYGKSVQSTMKLGQVRGVSLLAASQRQLAITEYSPREVKRSVTGNGAAAKQQVEFMVRQLLNIKVQFKKPDEADGLALAICHALQSQIPRSRAGSWKTFIDENPGRVRA